MKRTFLVAALLGVAAVRALAQESPELPAAGALQPGGVITTPFFYKGKGPGRTNSYVERYEEDYSYLRDPTLSAGPFDPLKYIPFDSDGGMYLTLNGEIRFRYDDTDHRNFGIATGATPGKVLAFTPATGISSNQLHKQRYELC